MYSSEKAARPFFFILKAFGLACFTVDEKTKSIRTTLFDKALFAATVCLWTTLTWLQVRKKIKFDESLNGISLLVPNLWMYSIIIQHFFDLLVVVTSFRHQTRIERFFKIIRDFDQKVFRVGWKSVTQEKHFKTALVVFSIFVLLAIVYSAVQIAESKSELLVLDLAVVLGAANDAFIMLFNIAVSAQFIFSVFCIHSRLNSMNINLRYGLISQTCSIRLKISI